MTNVLNEEVTVPFVRKSQRLLTVAPIARKKRTDNL